MKSTFFDYEFLKDIIGALIGTLTALAIYFLTIRHDRKKQQVLETKLKKEKMIYLDNLIKSFLKNVSGLNEALKTLIAKFEKDPISFHLPEIPVDEASHILNELLKTENLFIAHTEMYGQQKIKNYNNLRIEVSFMLVQSAQIDDMNNRAKQYDFDRKKDVTDIIDKIMETLIGIYDINDSKIPEQFKQDIFNFAVNFEKKLMDRTDLRFYQNEYLLPLSKMLVKFSNDEFIFHIISMIKRALIIMEHIETNNIHHLNQLKLIQEKIEELIIQVTQDSSHIEMKKYI